MKYRLVKDGKILSRSPDPAFPLIRKKGDPTSFSAPEGCQYFEVISDPDPPTPGDGEVLAGLPDAVVGNQIYTNRKQVVAKPVPQEVTPRQFQLAIESLHPGMLATIDAIVATQPLTVQINWNKALGVKRDDPTLEAMRQHPALDKTPAEVDDIFRLAATL